MSAQQFTVTDDDALTVKVSTRGFRIMRGKGQNRPFVFVRPAEVINLTNLLIDAYEESNNQ
jgi:hypothetical protein